MCLAQWVYFWSFFNCLRHLYLVKFYNCALFLLVGLNLAVCFYYQFTFYLTDQASRTVNIYIFNSVFVYSCIRMFYYFVLYTVGLWWVNYPMCSNHALWSFNFVISCYIFTLTFSLYTGLGMCLEFLSFIYFIKHKEITFFSWKIWKIT